MGDREPGNHGESFGFVLKVIRQEKPSQAFRKKDVSMRFR